MGKPNTPPESGNTCQFHVSAAPLAPANPRVAAAVSAQRRSQAIQSTIMAGIILALICAILWLIAILPNFSSTPEIITYQAPMPREDAPLSRPDLARGMRPQPADSSSARARTIAAATTGLVAVPQPDDPVQTGPFGIDDDFNAGWGAGDGDGDGGGGSSFFGQARPGKRVAYIVDFSLSMTSDSVGGGTRIAALKKELARSINALDPKMNFTVIFFSHNAWTIDSPGENAADRGWNGLGPVPPVNWYPAESRIKEQIVAKVQAMPPQGNTQWYPGLKMAFAMKPPPDIVYLLSDGEPRDFDQVLNEMGDIDPHKVPVDTIAFELPGTPASYMRDVSRETGGKFAIVYKGRLVQGSAADALTASKYDDGDAK